MAPQSAAAAEDVCQGALLTKAKVSASVRLEDKSRTYVKVVSRLTVEVPRSWPLATGLLLGQGSEEYRRSMRCLLRGPESQFQWWSEWRAQPPKISSDAEGQVRVQVDTYGWADQEGLLWVGPWNVQVGKDHWWIRLDPAAALRTARWTSVVVDAGSASVLSVKPRPTAREGAAGLVWKPQGRQALPEVSARLDPSWQRSWATQHDRLRFHLADHAGSLLWDWLVVLAVLCLVRRTRRSATQSPSEAAALGVALRWSWVVLLMSLLTSVSATFSALNRHVRGVDWSVLDSHYALLVNLIIAAVLLVFGRPAWPVWLMAFLVGLPVALVALVPEEVGLNEYASLPEGATNVMFLKLFVASGCAFALLFLGWSVACWRILSFFRPAGGGHGGSSALPPTHGRFPLRSVGPWIFVTVSAFGACVWLKSERAWQRSSWLSDQSDLAYGLGHVTALRDDLTWFAANSQSWWSGYLWLLTSLAILAVIRARAVRTGSRWDVPESVDRQWLVVLFPVLVGLSLGLYVGNGLLAGLFVLINMGAFRLAVTLGERRSLWRRQLVHSKIPLGQAVLASQRSTLLDRARRYREIHAKLRRLDHGQVGDEVLNRRALEGELRALHRWRAPSGVADQLPANVSVIDVTLALGPRATWWANGRRAAFLAGLTGLPASVLLVWSDNLRGEFLTAALYSNFGVPDVVMAFVYWEVTWAGAGFLLGALWRLLPGRRGPMRSLPIAAAYILPIAVDASLNWVTREEQGNLALYALAMLLVLTLTGIACDLDTFRGERRYWQSRVGLLLSVYQMRYFSLQMAYLLAQLIALLTLWQFFTDDGGPPQRGVEGQSGGTAGS